jgi:hypothetical protein
MSSSSLSFDRMYIVAVANQPRSSVRPLPVQVARLTLPLVSVEMPTER